MGLFNHSWNPIHRFLFAGVVWGIAIALLVRIVQLDRTLPRCIMIETDGHDNRGRPTKVSTVIKDQQPCQIFSARMVPGCTAIVNTLIYFITGFKQTVNVQSHTSQAVFPNGQSFSVWNPTQGDGSMPPPGLTQPAGYYPYPPQPQQQYSTQYLLPWRDLPLILQNFKNMASRHTR